MSRSRTVTSLVATAASLLTLSACAGGTATLSVPVAPRLKVPAWARIAPPLTERQAGQLIREFGARRAGQVPLERDPAEVRVIHGAFTSPDAQEAVASFHSGLLGARAWQTWLLEWRDTGWHAVRPITTSCSGSVEVGRLQQRGSHVLLVREACARFGREDGRVRLLAVGPRDDVELFSASETAGPGLPSGVARVRHSVWLTGFDAAGHAELVDLAFTEHRVRADGAGKPSAVVMSRVTTYRPSGERLLALRPAGDAAPSEQMVTASW